MRTKAIDHIGIAVWDLEKSQARWAALFGAISGPVEELEERGVRLVKLNFPEGPTVELISPLGDASPLTKFLTDRGEGIHHFCFEVEDIGAMMDRLKIAGLEMASEKPQKGAAGSLIAFIHPRSLNGVLVELVESKAPRTR
jgi:methylmalonyl-CoA/ethylmalonyl-CoA epimerase